MSAGTSIEWCDHSWSPWWGCTPVSPGCSNCYAAAIAKRFHGIEYRRGGERRRVKNWSDPAKWNRRAAKTPGPRRPRVFSSMMDWLDDEIPVALLADFLALIHATPNLDWLLLTKRPENWRARMKLALAAIHCDPTKIELNAWLCAWLVGSPAANVWVGVSAEDQTRADERIPALLAIPAAVRFVSVEPMLGPVDLRFTNGLVHGEDACDFRLDWIICGGESGPKARPMHPDWPRALREQCQAADVSFFFKQWGEWLPAEDADEIVMEGRTFASDEATRTYRVGKKRAGRLLDGREWNEFPLGAQVPEGA